MKTRMKLAAAVLIGIPLIGITQAQQPKCKDITFSQEFLTKFPRAGAACNEVHVVKGEQWARFNAEVKHIEGTHVNVDLIDNGNRPVGANVTFEFTPDATVTLTNREVKPASALKEGNRVVIWVPEKRFGFYAKAGAAESKQWAVVQ
jgi:hypothetical protein